VFYEPYNHVRQYDKHPRREYLRLHYRGHYRGRARGKRPVNLCRGDKEILQETNEIYYQIIPETWEDAIGIQGSNSGPIREAKEFR